MFMLTHTYFLQKILESAGLQDVEPDIYVYNVAPDLLAIHPQITAARTHHVQRSLKAPGQYPKSDYVMYHLLIDDLSHHGYICSDYQEEFNINSKGYSYIKGNHLVKSILSVYKSINKDISINDAVYQSHLIIEMIYDLVIFKHIHSYGTIDILVEAIKFTVERKMNEFVATMHWLYGLEEKEIVEVMKSALLFITRESMVSIMNMEGRINLYKDKFGLRSDKKLFDDGLKDLFQRAVELIDDDELFYKDTVKVIKEYNTLNFFK